MGMTKNIVSLDLGVGSIGVALWQQNKEDATLNPQDIKTFVRIFNPSNQNVDRRTKRISRRTQDRAQIRKLKLWEELANIDFAKPYSKESVLEQRGKHKKVNLNNHSLRFSNKVLKADIYKLRNDALDKQLSKHQIGYILYHLANHRGSSAISATDDNSKAKGDNKSRLNKTSELILKEDTKKYRTYGETLYKENQQDADNKTCVRNKENKNFQYFADRYLIIEEAKAILKQQQTYYANELTNEKIEKLLSIIDFESEKDIPAPKPCIYTGELTLPLASELYEERRILENLNNVRVAYKFDAKWKKDSLNEKQIDILFKALFEEGKDLSEAEVKKLLKDTVNTNDVKYTLPGRKTDKKLKGSSIKQLQNIPFYKGLTKEQQDEFVRKYIGSPDERTFQNYLKETYKLPYSEIIEIINHDAMNEKVLRKGYSDICESLTKKVVKLLRSSTNSTYNHAIEQLKLDGSIKEKENKVYDILPYYGEVLHEYTQPVVARSYLGKFKDKSPIKQKFNDDELKHGQIPNPVIHKTLNQLRKVLNELMKEYGKIDEIIIEYARELSMSAKEREDRGRTQTANEKEIETIKGILKEKGDKDPNSKKVKVYKLAKQQGWICAYSGRTIGIQDIIDNRVDLEHIIPESFSHDSRRANLVAAFTDMNQIKGDKTPYEAFFSTKYWDNIQQFLNNHPYEKYNEYNGWRFAENAREEFRKRNPFLQRYKTDTSYIAKASRKYLQCLVENKYNVYTFKSDLIALARHQWGYNNLTAKFTKDYLNNKEKESLEKEANAIATLKKNRLDHRHHALDALMLLLVNRGQQQKISTLSGKHGKDFLKKFLKEEIDISKLSQEDQDKLFATRDEIINNAPLSRSDVKNILQNTKISQSINHKKEGQVHAETQYILEKDSKDDTNFITIKSTKTLEIKDLKLKLDDEFKNKEKVKEAIAKQINISHTINLDEGKRDSYAIAIKNMIGSKTDSYAKLDDFYEEAKAKIAKENAIKAEEGKKLLAVTEKTIWARALKMLFLANPKGYKKFENKKQGKILITKEPSVTENKTGSGFATGNNHCIDLYYNKKGELKGEIIRTCDALNKNFEPQYKKEGFAKVETLFNGDIIELKQDINHKHFSNPNTGAPTGKVWLRILTYTESSNIPIYFKFYNKSGGDSDTNTKISVLGKLGFHRVILTPLGNVKYRSSLLQHKNK